MNDSQISLLRSILKIGGGYLIAKGLVDDNQLETVISSLLTLGAVVWGMLHRSGGDPTSSSNGRTGLFLVLGLCGLLALPGCTMSPQKTIYNSHVTVQATVERVMQGWGDYVAKYHPPVEQEQAVADALEQYKAAEIVAIDASRMAAAALSAGTNAPAITAGVDAAQQAAQGRLTDLVSLIQQFKK